MNRRSEEELIQWIARSGFIAGDFVNLGIGDDAAVCRLDAGAEIVVTTDLLVEGQHFSFATSPPRDIGWKVGAVNLSDIAAMGASPAAFFLAVALPPDAQDLFAEIMPGLYEILAAHGATLAGGDLSAAQSWVFAGTAIGQLPQGSALRRDGAQPGDIVYITGQPGFAGAGLRLLSAGYRKLPEGGLAAPDGHLLSANDLRVNCVDKHLHPRPLIEVGRFLRESGAVTAAIDTSDGIAKDLRQIARQSGLAAELRDHYLERMLHPGVVTLVDVLGGGEDYDLLFTVKAEQAMSFGKRYAAQPNFPALHCLGRMTKGQPGQVLMATSAGLQPLPVSGFDHFHADPK